MHSLTESMLWQQTRLSLSRHRLRLACGNLDSASRACRVVLKSGLRRIILFHVGVQLALAIFSWISNFLFHNDSPLNNCSFHS